MKIFKDIGVSGTEIEREGLNQLITNFNGVKKVIVLNTSRLWRNDTTNLIIKRQFKKLKVDVISIEQPGYSIYTKDPNNFLINGIFEVLDPYERMSTNIKLARGRRAKTKEGIKGCGETPLGYEWQHDGVKRPVVVKNEVQAIIVKEVFQKYLELKSLRKVANYLNEHDYKTKRGKKFSPMSIRNILTNEFYIGKVKWKELSIAGKHDPIITISTFDKVQFLLKLNQKKN